MKEMDKKLYRSVMFVGLMMATTNMAYSQDQSRSSGLVYNTPIQGPAPIPSSERQLQTVTAQLWYKVANTDRTLESPIFDRQGNLFFCDVTGHRVMRLTPDKQISTIVTLKDFAPGGLAWGKDGRLFIAAINFDTNSGGIFVVNADGSNMQTIVPAKAGYLPNDLVFDSQGGFYFTDFKGTVSEPKGGVDYVSPDFKIIQSVVSHLVLADGIALSQDGHSLWITEFGRNLLHHIQLATPTTLTSIGSTIAYHFTGAAPDSMRIDADGNLYVAMYGQGRFLVFNKNGFPIGQIVLPDRDQGRNLRTTSMIVHPDTNDLYAVTGDEKGGAIFRTKVFTHGLK